MKNRYLVFPAVGFVTLILIAWIWRDIPRYGRQPRPNAVHNTGTDAAMPQVATSNPDVQTPGKRLATPTKEDQMRTMLDSYNHKDIEFYGTVVDQFGSPIPQVEVTGSVIYNSSKTSGVQEARTTTDSEGAFFFTGMKGRTFDYHLEKSGYQTMPDRDAFDYTELVPEEKRHRPDPRNPVVLKMWKLQKAEPLVHFERKYFRMPADGTPVRIDMTTGKQVDGGGDLVFEMNHIVLERGMLPEPQFDWRARVEIAGGGLIETKQRLMYLAPENGYVPIVTIDMPALKPDWANSITRNFYARTRGNLFGRIAAYINANQRGYDPSYVMLEWWLNPKPDSRNLEVEPDQSSKVTAAEP